MFAVQLCIVALLRSSADVTSKQTTVKIAKITNHYITVELLQHNLSNRQYTITEIIKHHF